MNAQAVMWDVLEQARGPDPVKAEPVTLVLESPRVPAPPESTEDREQREARAREIRAQGAA